MLNEASWDLPPDELRISADEVHVWRIPLDRPAEVVARLGRTLDPEERRRADRFHSATHRAHFVVGRGSLRAILGRYLAADPAGLAFRYGPKGKPELAGSDPGFPLRFNLAHSHGLALLAVALGRPVGIDLERVRPMDDLGRIVARFFSAAERSAFFALPEDQRAEAFFRGWTRKEAYMKATGEGFAMPLDRFDVALAPGEPPGLLRVDGRPHESARWTFRDLVPGPEYRAALAVEGSGWSLLAFRHQVEGDVD